MFKVALVFMCSLWCFTTVFSEENTQFSKMLRLKDDGTLILVVMSPSEFELVRFERFGFRRIYLHLPKNDETKKVRFAFIKAQKFHGTTPPVEVVITRELSFAFQGESLCYAKLMVTTVRLIDGKVTATPAPVSTEHLVNDEKARLVLSVGQRLEVFADALLKNATALPPQHFLDKNVGLKEDCCNLLYTPCDGYLK